MLYYVLLLLFILLQVAVSLLLVIIIIKTISIIAFIIFNSAQKLIFDTDNPLAQAKRWVPFYMFLAGFVLALVTIKKGLKHLGLNIGSVDGYVYAIIAAVIVAVIGKIFINRLKFDESAAKKTHYANVEKVFALLMIVTACAMAFAHGSNDVATNNNFVRCAGHSPFSVRLEGL